MKKNDICSGCIRLVALACALLFAFLCFVGCSLLESERLAGVFSSSFSQPGGDVRINEVVSSNARSYVQDILGTPDWIEIVNTGDARINLEGCHLSDNIREPQKWEFPAISIEPGEHLLLFATSYEGELPDGVYCTGFGLSKGGESLYFTDRYLGILDKVDIPPLQQDVSYARDAAGRFGFCGVPTPGAANGGTIVSSMSEISYANASAQLVLSEVVPVNENGLTAGNGRRYPWAEVHNTGTEPIRMSQYYLSDDALNFQKWQLPDRLIQPGERQIIFFSEQKDAPDGLHATFRLGSTDDALYLSDGQGHVVGELAWTLPMVPNIAVISDGQSGPYSSLPTPGAPNHVGTFSSLGPSPMDANDPVILNEALPRNQYSAIDRDGDRPEWAELYNRSGADISLLGYALSDDSGNPAKWMFPDVTIPAGGYLLVFLSGKDRVEGELHASFGLSTQDEVLLLTNLDGMRQDSIPLNPEIRQNVSLGKDETGNILYFGTPTPGAKNDSAGFAQLAAVPGRNPDGVFISEVSAVSSAKSGKADWIEFYNPSSRDMSLAGWRISDDIDEPDKYTIQSLTIPAGGHAVMQTSSGARSSTMASFGVSGSGETLFLTDSEGILRDWFTTGVLGASVTSGRLESDASGARVFFTSATPGAENSGTVYPGYASAPVFSDTTLYHDAPVTISLSTATPGASIHYTTDGSKPTAESPLYTGPLTMQGNTPLRAIAIAAGMLNSAVSTQTYLFVEPHTLPVVCINGSSEDFSTVNSAVERSQRTEREMHMAYYEANGRLGVSAPCGLRASGSSTLTYAQKSFTLYFRGAYGRSSIAYPFFPEYWIDTFSSLIIRNSGQDRSNARLRDSYYSLAVEGMYIDNVATRPVVVYINGDYWGLYDLNENQNEDFLASHYGVDPNAVDIIRRNVSVLAGSNTDNKRVRAFGHGQDLSVQGNYEEYCQWVDIDYVNDYLIAQTFFANGDMFNQKYWRSHDYTVKWRPVFYDLDYGFSHNNPTRNILPRYFDYAGEPSQDGSITNMDLFCGLPANASWREQFVKRYVYIVETHLNAERLTALLDEVAAEMRPEMQRHISKWRYPSSVSTWEANVKALRDCLAQRPENALKAVQRQFDISDAQMEQYRQEVRGVSFMPVTT